MSVPDSVLSEPIWNQIRKSGTQKVIPAGKTIINERHSVYAVPFIEKGSVKVVHPDEDGREMLLYYIRPGETCVMSVLGGFSGNKSAIKAIAEHETTAWFVKNDALQDIIRKNPAWLKFIFGLYDQRYKELLDVVEALAFKKMDDRLAELLIKKRKASGSRIIHVTHEQLAEELATARGVVSRLLKQMESEDMVILGRNKITLLKPLLG